MTINQILVLILISRGNYDALEALFTIEEYDGIANSLYLRKYIRYKDVISLTEAGKGALENIQGAN